MSIRKRLTLLFAILLSAIGLIRITIELTSLSNTLRNMAQTDSLTRVEQVQSYLSELHGEKVREGAAMSLENKESLPSAFYDDGLYVQFSDRNGRLINKSPNLGSLAFPPRLEAGAEVVELTLPHLLYSPQIMLVTRPLILGGQKVGWIQVGRALQGLNRAYHHAMAFHIVGWILALLLALWVGSLFASWAMEPIRRITEEVNRWDSHDLSRRLPEGATRDEIEDLVQTFNRLFDRIEHSFEAQRRFVADASHELKSPLTAIKGNLQLLDRLEDAPPESRRDWIRLAGKEVNRLIRLTSDLLDLAHVRGDERPLNLCALDWVRLGEEVTQSYPSVRIKPHPPLWVQGDEDRLRQVLINLLQNARRATSERVLPSIQLEWGQTEEWAIMRVRDNGIGIPKEALPRLFDRFYRVDKSRSREQGGTGLGLSITQAIVEAHQGEIKVESEEGVGTTFEIRLPLDSHRDLS